MSLSLSDWQPGAGPVHHQSATVDRIKQLLERLDADGRCDPENATALLRAADRLCSMGMWLTVHMTYARKVYLDGRELQAEDFKPNPEGHTGGALNMVPAYVGYLLANALSGKTRAWMMGQGHCVAAIDAVNVLCRNLDARQFIRYTLTDTGLSNLCQDFYSYRVNADGRPAAPLGSHVNIHTAGGISEGGYLGFAGLQYVHMPLPGQELVSFLSDGAFEEQRGSDWAPRWWRGEDTGLVMPIMIANGRRIDQRTSMSQSGGVDWFREHLRLNGFKPVDIDGRDPAAFAWAIISMGQDLQEQHRLVALEQASYPVQLPYAIAETVKGYGFPGAGSNAAHNLPLGGNPSVDAEARRQFNEACHHLYVPLAELNEAIATLMNHEHHKRVLEKDHCLRRLKVSLPELPAGNVFTDPGSEFSTMAAIDHWFASFVQLNPCHRVRVGNPDEMRSNRLNQSLDLLRHRVTAPEPGIAEAVCGAVITALNEEAVVSAALANKQGINLVASYEAFAVKMLGAMRQEALFARHSLEAGQEVAWLSVPVLLSSHTWENGKNEQSHQDPTLCEAWLGEMSDVAPVLFPFDANTGVALMESLYRQRGRIAVVVAAKGSTAVCTDMDAARLAVSEGALLLSHDTQPAIQLIAIGAYQLQEATRAASVLRESGVRVSVVAMLEPGRFRAPRDEREGQYVHEDAAIDSVIPPCERRLFICHGHSEVMTGVLRRLDTGSATTRFMGYRNRGGTLDVFGMLLANRQTWAHIVDEAAKVLGIDSAACLSEAVRQALAGNGNIDLLRCPLFQHGLKTVNGN